MFSKLRNFASQSNCKRWNELFLLRSLEIVLHFCFFLCLFVLKLFLMLNADLIETLALCLSSFECCKHISIFVLYSPTNWSLSRISVIEIQLWMLSLLEMFSICFIIIGALWKKSLWFAKTQLFFLLFPILFPVGVILSAFARALTSIGKTF